MRGRHCCLVSTSLFGLMHTACNALMPAQTLLLLADWEGLLKINAMVKKLIIDTDTGVDDAMAILMALEAHKR